MHNEEIVTERLDLLNSLQASIRCDTRYKNGGIRMPVVIVCHSFMAFKDWGFFPYVGEQLARSGFASITFNFSHNGVAGDGERITDFSKFENNTISQELEDLNTVIDAVHDETLSTRPFDETRIALLGHSRGGGVAIVQTARDERVKALVTWSAISTFDRWTKRQKEEWRSVGYLPLARDTSYNPLRIGMNYLDDLERNSQALDLQFAARDVRVPWLLLHGMADVTVPHTEAQTLFGGADKNTATLQLLGNLGHTYNATSVDEDNYQTLNSIINLTTTWLHRQFE